MLEVAAAVVVVAVTIAAVRRLTPGPAADRPDAAEAALGVRVLVAVSNPSSGRSLAEVATVIAQADGGRVDGLTVITPGEAASVRSLAQETAGCCEAVAVENGLDAEGRVRVDTSVAAGVEHQAVESGASLLVLGWPNAGDATAAALIGDTIGRAPGPVLVARLHGYRWERIVLGVPVEPVDDGTRASLRVATEVADRLAHRHDVPVLCVRDHERVGHVPHQLLLLPVAPRVADLERAVHRARPLGDVALALSHGPHARHGREVLGAAAVAHRSTSA